VSLGPNDQCHVCDGYIGRAAVRIPAGRCTCEEKIMSDDGNWLRRARERLGLTQRQFAERLQLKATGSDYVRHMEKGRRPVSGPIKVAVASMLADDIRARVAPDEQP
jgi:DNA-binding XRE family transcriptional regulator